MERIRISWRQTVLVMAALVLAFGLAGCEMITSVLGGDSGGNNKPGPSPSTLQPPSSVVATLSGNTVTLTWDPAADEAGDPPDSYKVLQSSTANGTFSNVTTADSDGSFSNLSFVKTLAAGQSAWFKVSGVFSGTEGPRSGAVQATTQAAVFTAPVLSASGTASSISLSWTATGAISYQLYRVGLASPIFTGTGTFFNDFDVLPGTSYSYTVKAFYAGGEATSIAAMAMTNSNNVTPPSAPMGLFVGSATQTSLTVTWTTVPGVTYDVKRNAATVATNLTTGFFPDTGLTAGTYYAYEVIAKNSAGTASAVYQGQTLALGVNLVAPGTPTILTVTSTAANPGRLTISWNTPNPPDASVSYSLYRDSQPNGTFSNKIADQLTTSPYIDMNLANGMTYYYKLQATKSGYNGTVPIQASSPLSAPVSGTTPMVAMNYAPYLPTGPFPSTGSTGIDPTTIGSLSWSWAGDPEGDPLTYDLFVSVNGGSPQQKLFGSQNTYWTPPAGFFAYSTYYSWYVIVHDNHDNTTVGGNWTFQTMAPTVSPPTVSFSVTSGQSTFVSGVAISVSAQVNKGVSPYTLITTTSNPSWTLYYPDGTSSFLGSGATMSFTPQQTGNYYLYLTASDGGVPATVYQSFNVVAPSQGTAIITIN